MKVLDDFRQGGISLKSLGTVQRRAKALDNLVEGLKLLPAERFAEIVAQTKQTGLSLFGAPVETSARVGAALKARAAAVATDELADDSMVGDEVILAARDRAYVNKWLHSMVASRDQETASRALTRLVLRAVQGDRGALEFLRSLTFGFPVDAGFNEYVDMKQIHLLFTGEHVRIIQAAISGATGSFKADLEYFLQHLAHEIVRPDLFP